MNASGTGEIRATTLSWMGAGFWVRVLLVLFFLVGSLLTVNYLQARALPDDQPAVEDQLDRDVYAYLKLDGKGYVATVFGDQVIFDHLVLDPNPMGFPPEPRWQWSGDWTSIPVIDGPASARIGHVSDTRVLFGQITDASIVSLEVKTSTMSIMASVQ